MTLEHDASVSLFAHSHNKAGQIIHACVSDTKKDINGGQSSI